MTQTGPPFSLFGPDHVAVLAALAGASAWLVLRGRSLPRGVQVGLGRLLGSLLIGYAVAAYARKAMQSGVRWEDALPLHLCDWLAVACVVALFRPRPFLFEIAYFWGFAGALQATLTPDLRTGFPSWPFIHFFWGHGGILLAIVYLMSVERLRPRPGGVGRAFAALLGYVLVVGTVNALTGWNYGYLCRPPSGRSLLDYLGPWPWYVVSGAGLALLSFYLLELPWRLADRRAAKRDAGGDSPLPSA